MPLYYIYEHLNIEWFFQVSLRIYLAVDRFDSTVSGKQDNWYMLRQKIIFQDTNGFCSANFRDPQVHKNEIWPDEVHVGNNI